MHLAPVDAQPTEPDQRDAGDIDGQRGYRQHQRLPVAGGQRGTGQGVIGLSEPVALKVFAGERPDHPHTGQLVAHHPVDAVDQALHAAEQRQQVRHDPVVAHAQNGNAYQQQPGQRGLLVDGHDDSANAHDGRGHQHGSRHLHQEHDLADVIGAAGQQSRRAEPGGLRFRERDDVFEHCAAQVASEAGTGPGAEVHHPDRAQHLQPGDPEHHHAEPDDGGGIALRDAFVDDGGIDRRKVQRRQGADQLQSH